MRTMTLHIGSVAAWLTATALVACNPFSEPSALEPMSLEPQGGTAQVERRGDVLEVTGRFSLEPGDVIKTAASGARLKLEGRRLAWIRGRSRVRVQNGTTLHNLSGSVLVRTQGDTTRVVFDDVTASSSDGMFRVDRATATSSAVTYRGVTVVRAPGQEPVAIKPLFASSAAGGVLDVVPYRADASDPWDRLAVNEVMELDAELEGFSRALAARLDDRVAAKRYFSRLAGRRAFAWMTPYVNERSAADVLIAFGIARLEASAEGSLRSHFTAAFDLRDDEAPWGVVATIMGAEPKRLIAGLESIVSATGIATADSRDASSSVSEGSGQIGDRSGRPSALCINVFDCLLEISPRGADRG